MEQADNFAISGACATTGLPNCQNSSTTVQNEITEAQSLHLKPTLVTLTLGADDINFKSCLLGVLGLTNLPGVSNTGTCSNSATDLSAIQQNVQNVIARISSVYPGVPIVLTQYYDPLPASFPVQNTNSPCHPQELLYAAAQAFQYHNPTRAFETLITNDAGGAATDYLDNVASSAALVDDQLNTALFRAAATERSAGVAVQTVPLDFSGHDLCEDYPGGSGDVFGLGLYAFGAYLAGPSASKTVQYVPSDTCAVFDAGCKSFAKTWTGSFLDRKYSLTVIASLNDLPHPTTKGQITIAEQILAKVGG